MNITRAAFAGLVIAMASPALTQVSSASADDLIRNSNPDCPLNAFKCKKFGRPQYPRCYTIKVRDRNGEVRKKRVCTGRRR